MTRANSSVRKFRESNGKVLFQPTIKGVCGVARFTLFQEKLLAGEVTTRSSHAHFACCLIAWDGVVTTADIAQAISAATSVYQWKNNACLEWGEGPIDRRYLSPFSITAHRCLDGAAPPYDDLVTDIDCALEGFYRQPPGQRFPALIMDAQAWVAENLPGTLAMHCVGAARLTALPRSTLAREETKKSLEISTPATQPEMNMAFATMLSGYFGDGADTAGMKLLKRLLDICRQRKAISEASDKKRMLLECAGLSDQFANSGRVVSVLAAWSFDLIESGTSRTPDFAPASVEKYIHSVLLQLWTELREKNIDELDANEFSDVYTAITGLSKQPQVAAAALKSFHAFLMMWCDVPPLTKSIYEGIEAPSPRANVVWPHERNLINEWLDNVQLDERLLGQVRVSLEMTSEIRIRAMELSRIRIENVRLWESCVEIEIVPRHGRRLKSYSGKRVEVVKGERANVEIRAWIERRRAEAALNTDLLFGDPYAPNKNYRAGPMFVLLNRLLKTVSGDPTISFHTFSHTWVSEKVSLILNAPIFSSEESLEQVSADAGHASPQTTLTHYFHTYEKSLRWWLDVALREIGMTSLTVSKHAGISASAFRKRCERASVSSAELAWKLIAESTSLQGLPKASDGIPTRDARPPAELMHVRKMGFVDVLRSLCDLTAGYTVISTSLRANIEEGQVRVIAAHGDAALREVGAGTFDSGIASEWDAIMAIQALGLGKDAFDFKRINQAKTKSLHMYLSNHASEDRARSGVWSWRRCFSRGYVSLCRPADAVGFIQLLHTAGMPLNHIVIYVEGALDSIDANIENTLGNIFTIFEAAWSARPLVDFRRPRRGRPKIYITLSGVTLIAGDDGSSASLSMAGINALMLTVDVYSRMLEKSWIPLGLVSKRA